ncbi:helix-turn-helix domain-containing protein [Breznakiella homolactica]|uniref:Helix-turn-helix domain-containing protein n=1 Tax=Breznakiella homolactica TaxID=2798577 RepID=A0A7T7XPG2_9SPIR|nr:helix-turn-helix domain-containing protein [Breznakiella homolactica]
MIPCLTLQETARYLGVEERHVYYLAEMGYLEGWKIRSEWRFYKGAVERYAGGTDIKRINGKSSRYSDDKGYGFFS